MCIRECGYGELLWSRGRKKKRPQVTASVTVERAGSLTGRMLCVELSRTSRGVVAVVIARSSALGSSEPLWEIARMRVLEGE